MATDHYCPADCRSKLLSCHLNRQINGMLNLRLATGRFPNGCEDPTKICIDIHARAKTGFERPQRLPPCEHLPAESGASW